MRAQNVGTYFIIMLLIMGGLFMSQSEIPGGGGAATTLTSTQVGYGSATNGVTSEAAFSYDAANNRLTVGAVRTPDGTCAAPAYSFTDDPDTGITASTGNTLSLCSGGTERWRVRSAGHLVPISATLTIGDATARGGGIYMTTTDNSGTPGNTTINAPKGRAAFAATGSLITVTNSVSAAASSCMATLAAGDATCLSVRCTPAAGSLTLQTNAACTAITFVDFVLLP